MSDIPTLKIEMVILLRIFNSYITYLNWGCRDHTVVGFTPGIPVFSTNNTDLHDITEILLKCALNTINLTLTLTPILKFHYLGI